MRRPASYVLVLLAASAVIAGPLSAQDRGELVQQARNQLSDDAALTLYLRAADPTLGPPDSLWAVAVHEMALTLIVTGEEETASTWLRWAARHGSQWPIDRSLSTSVVQAYDEAAASLEADEVPVSTRWSWPDGFEPDQPGSVEVVAGEAPLSVAVEGRGAVPAGGVVEMPPGTYEMAASAAGYESATFTREVLPGATTVLELDLVPLLPPGSEVAVGRTLVTIRYGDGANQVCTTGYMARPQGFVLTSLSALGQTTGLEVVTPTTTIGNVSVAGTDTDLDLALLRLDLEDQPVLDAATGQSGDYMWSMFATGCQGTATARTRLAAAPTATSASLSLPLPSAALGGPLFDRDGRLLGTVVGPDRVIPMSAAERLLAQVVAEGPDGAAIVPPDGGDDGGPPWLLIGAGAAAVGVAVALLTGSNGNGGDPTGSIVVSFPGGAP